MELALAVETVMIESHKDKWVRVIFIMDCTYEIWDTEHEHPNCPVCKSSYTDCPCPGPSMETEYDYKEIKGILYAKKKKDG